MSILPIFIPHAGCPHQCVFCNQKKISGQESAALDAARAQIARWRSWLRPGVQHEAAFYGGSFTGLPLALQRQLLSLTDALLAEGFIGSVRLSTRPDYIDDERLELLKQHQVRTVELGVQSLDDEVLRAAGRGHTAAQVAAAMQLLKKYGFKTGMQLMVGLPEQSFASVQQTAQQAISMQPDIARIYPLLVLKDTPLAADFASGRFTPLTLAEAVEQAAWLYNELTQADIKVIRVGLQADEELCNPGNIIAGPFHPSMGELVKSRLLREKLTPKLAELAQMGVGGIDLCCPPKLESKLRGQKNCNLLYWQQLFPEITFSVIHVNADEVKVCPSASLLIL